MSRFERLAAAAAAALLVAGCATPVAPPTGEPVSLWSGRFAATWLEPGDPAHEERATGKFSLRESGATTELRVFSPFGQTVAHAIASPSGAVLETSDGSRHEAADPDTLTEQVLGWRIPVGRLPDWLRASGRAGEPPAPFVDSGWSISPDAGEGGGPRRLTLRWPVEAAAAAAWARKVTIRLVLDATEPPATSAR